MPPLVIPDAAQVVIEGTAVGQGWTNVFGVGLPELSPPLTVEMATAIRDTFEAYYSDLEPRRHTSWAVQQVTVTDVRAVGAPQYVFSVGDIVGSGSGEPLPPDMAIVHSWRAERRGGSYRGRTYHTGFTEEGMDDGRLGEDEQAAEQLAATGLIESFDPGSSLVILSRTLGEAVPVVRAVVNDVFDRQLRRRFPQ